MFQLDHTCGAGPGTRYDESMYKGVFGTMAVLTEKQIKNRYFDEIGGFPSLSYNEERINYAVEVKDYKGQERLCICCTQLDYFSYSERDKKRILKEWIDFLRINTKTFKGLHFNSHVPQRLFDAVCGQEDLEEFRVKWGNYKDLSALEQLTNLKFLFLGTCPGVTDLTPITKLKNLIVLYIQNFKRIEDYSPLIILDKLEQLIISGPILGRTPVKDLEFLKEMHNLLSVWIPGTMVRKKYSPDELAKLRKDMPDLHDIYGCIWGLSNL